MERKEGTAKVLGFWVSPFVHRVRWALKIKGIDYEYIEEDIFNKSPLLFEVNPVYAKVPVLIHNEKPLPESFIILEYIDETWENPPLLPRDPFQRAEARFWARFVDEKVLESAWFTVCSEGENKERGVKLTMEALEKIEEKLKGKVFFGGNTIGYLDLAMGFVSYMLPVWEEIACVKILDPLKFPAITSWIDSFLDHDIIKGEYLPSKADMITYFQWRRKEFIPLYASKVWMKKNNREMNTLD